MPADEFALWREFEAVEPMPDPYWIGALICTVIANVMGGKKSRSKIEDFLPRPARSGRGPKQSVAEMRAQMASFFARVEAIRRAKGG